MSAGRAEQSIAEQGKTKIRGSMGLSKVTEGKAGIRQCQGRAGQRMWFERRAEQSRATQSRAGPIRFSQRQRQLVRVCEGKAGQVRACSSRAGQDNEHA